MNCSDSQKRLSDYYDDQLPRQQRDEMALHVDQCETCLAELDDFARLSRQVADGKTPAPPAAIWENIQSALRAEQSAQVIKPRPSQVWRRAYRWVAIAACLLIAAGLGSVGWTTWHKSRDARHAVDLGRYLDLFEQNPDEALKLLVAKYDGKPIALTTETTDHGTVAQVVRHLPSDYSLNDAHILKMPGCNCVHCTCRAADGETLAVLEHAPNQVVTFGKRPVIQTRCDGTNCKIVRVGDRLAVSWQQNNRCITVIGVRNLEEVEQLIARMNPKAPPS